MAGMNGLQGIGAPIDYFSIATAPAVNALNDSYRNDALEVNTQAQRQQLAQRQKDNQRRDEFYSAIANAAPGDLPALRQKYPEFAQNIQQEIGIQGAEHAAFVNSALNNLSVAASGGNPQQVMQAIQQGAPALSSLGVSAEDAMQLYQSNPQQFNSLLNATRLATLPIDKQFETQQNQQKIDETIRSNQAGEALTAQGQYISASNAAADRAQRAQIHSDDMGMKLMELGQKGKPSADLIKGLNSDITGFGKNYNAVKSAANSLQALSKVNTGAAQLGIIFNYMKSLDPQSVVREGEQVQVMRSDGIWGQMKGYVDQLNAGNGLSQEARDNIVNAAKINSNAMGQQFNQQVDEYLDTYGDAIPQGLKKSLGGRKAKLFDDIPSQPTSQQASQQTATPIQAGHSEEGYTFLGGDPANPASWRKN